MADQFYLFDRRRFMMLAGFAHGWGGGQQRAARMPPPPEDAMVQPLARLSREKIKITDVQVTLMSYELPPEKQWYTAGWVTWKTDAVLIRVFTDQGVVGIGEGSPYGGPEKMKPFIEEQLKPILVGQNPFDLEELALPWYGRSRVEACAWAGIDCALWDIIGKVKNQPVYRLLAAGGPAQKRIRVYASGGVQYAWYDRPEALIEEALRYKEEGYTAFKFRIGTEWKAAGMTINQYVPLLRKLREAVGPDFELIQEANMRWSLEQALEICPVLEELKFLWFEEPVRRPAPGDIEAYIKLNQALRAVMLSGGETMTTRWEFKEWIDRDAYDIVQPDCNTTGTTQAWHIARMAHLRGKYCCPHNWHGGLTTMANAALVAAIPNRLALELNMTYNPFKEDIFKDPLVVRNGYMELHDRPGYGMELIQGIEKKFPYLPGPYSRPNPKISSAV